MKSLEPAELARWRQEGRPLRLLDVREKEEWGIARIDGAELLPLSEAPAWLPGLAAEPGSAPIVVLCHHGVRSARVCGLLLSHGVQEVWNLRGGIDAWSQTVDDRVPRY